MMSALNPGFILILAGIFSLVIPVRRVRHALALIAPLVGIYLLTQATQNQVLSSAEVFDLTLILYRVDGLSFIFALAFLIAAFLNAIYAWHTDDGLQDGSALIYAGAAVAASLCGDLLTLFVFWELTAISSVFLIFGAGTRAAYGAGMRYLAIQILSGVLLLMGASQFYAATGTMELIDFASWAGQIGAKEGAMFSSLSEPGALAIFFALGIKAAFPFMHNWLQDSYPKATIVGTVVLSAFTTKLAVYALARMFAGLDELIWIGAIMTIFPVFFAVVENDLRRVLAYSLNNQVGFMVCAIGIGTPLALNGAAAHAFAHIMYKGLLFMSMGAVLHRVGTAKASELGGLYKYMPLTAVFCLVGAASISAFPLFSGFVAKSLTVSAVGYQGYFVIWCMLLFASAGVLEHSGIKIPYFAFFGHDSGKKTTEAPLNMLIAMGLAASLCVLIGLPAIASFGGFNLLYAIVPFPDATVKSAKTMFELGHVLTQLQLLLFAALAFILFQRFKLYPPEKPGTIMDTDWFYRRMGYGFVIWVSAVWAKILPTAATHCRRLSTHVYSRMDAVFSPQGMMARGPITGWMAIWVAVLLGAFLVLGLFM